MVAKNLKLKSAPTFFHVPNGHRVVCNQQDKYVGIILDHKLKINNCIKKAMKALTIRNILHPPQ